MSPDTDTENNLTCRLDPLAQTLFSARLIAEVLPRIWKLDPAEGESRLDELCRLTSGVLSEIHALLDEMQGVSREHEPSDTRINEEI